MHSSVSNSTKATVREEEKAGIKTMRTTWPFSPRGEKKEQGGHLLRVQFQIWIDFLQT